VRGIKRSVEIDGVPITQTKERSFPIVSVKLQKKKPKYPTQQITGSVVISHRSWKHFTDLELLVLSMGT